MVPRTEKTSDEPDIYNFQSNHNRCSLKSWIEENIKKKECCFYVQTEREGLCQCGYPKDRHVKEAFEPEEFRGHSWNIKMHMREVPTDAFGDIKFGGLGQNIGKYVRVSSDTQPSVLYHLMTEHWKLRPPNLLISVAGGAKNFYMKTHLKEKFRRGLIKVAESTGAWIITGGTHTGVMKHVGMAVRDHTLSSSSHCEKIVAIGVASWGTVHGQQSLIHPEGCFPAHYTLDEQSQGRLTCLDSNHSHFLLVDDGTHGRYGVEMDLRSHLEKHIAVQPLGNRESHGKIPVVCVVLDGGQGTLDIIYSAIQNGTPCVVLEGSGQMADVIAHFARMPKQQVTLTVIQTHLKRVFKEEYEELAEKILDIIESPRLLTVLNMDEAKNSDLDVAILQTFLQASRKEGSMEQKSWELELAVAWNNVDIANREIFTENSQWQTSDLHKAMFSALVGHKSEFVRLLLENGVNIHQFLSEERLYELYTAMPNCFFLRKLVKQLGCDQYLCKEVLLSAVGQVVRQLLGRFTQSIYPPQPRHHQEINMTDEVPGNTVTSDPWRDLFLWAIVQNNRELAQIAWEQCTDSIASALAASKILKKLACQSNDDDEDKANDMRELANHYERQAIGVFSECHSWDCQRAQKLLIRISPSWGLTTCLRLARQSNSKSFVAHSGVQALLTKIWCGGLAEDTPKWKIVLCMLFPPLICTGFITFRHDEESARKEMREDEIKAMRSYRTKSLADLRIKGTLHAQQKSAQQRLSCLAKLEKFYAAPQVKFFWNVFSYFGFLWLFSIVLMIDFQPTPSWRELLLYVWLTSLVFEEVRQFIYDPDGFGFQKKAKMYINDLWNIMDVASILLSIAGIVCRWTSSAFYTGKIILCIDFIMFCVRLMAIFNISRILGPKIIIVKRMMKDMFFFMFLLSICVVAYGVAKQAIMIHNEERLDWIFRGALYEPYLIVFGNLPTLTADMPCTVQGTDPLQPKCPALNSNYQPAFPEWLTIIMLCVYLLFANILLLNLLIAIFNYTFQEVQDNTDTIWKFQRYELIREYYIRPAAPPPFILLGHLYLIYKRVVKGRLPQKHKQFRVGLSKSEEEELLSWEAIMRDNYMATQSQERTRSMEHRIQDMADQVGSMPEQLEKGSLGKQLLKLEKQFLLLVSETTKALEWIMDTLKAQGCPSKEDPPSFSSLENEALVEDL